MQKKLGFGKEGRYPIADPVESTEYRYTYMNLIGGLLKGTGLIKGGIGIP